MTPNWFKTCALCAGLALSGAAQAENEAMAGYRSLPLPEVDVSGRDLFTLAGDFLDVIGLLPEDVGETSLRMVATDFGYQFDISLRGYQDDSVAGENYRLLIEPADNRYVVREAGVQFICARGINTTEPQTGYCP